MHARKKYIADKSEIVSCPNFEDAIVKIRTVRQKKLTESEQSLVEKLRLNNGDIEMRNSEEDSFQLGIQKRLAKIQKIKEKSLKYRNCDSILGSNAIIEKVFSIAKNVISENGQRTTP